jgi:signal transduction histidine kinase/ligand-binding sensor domain-containing protein
VLLLSVAAGTVALVAQVGSGRSSSPYLRDAWGREQGFPGRAISAIAQTADGYLWIGTENGLVRFDGLRFDTVAHSIRGAPPITRVLGLTADADGALWVRLQGSRLIRYTAGTFEEVSAPMVLEEAGFTAMSRAQSGSVVLLGLRSGLIRARGADFERLLSGVDLPKSIGISVAETPGGRVWIGTRDVGLYSVKGGVLASVAVPLPDRKINCLLAVDEHDLWIGTDAGIARWNGSASASLSVPSIPGSNQTLAMIRDREGHIWVGTARGLLRLDGNGAVLADERDATSGGAITALFEDREGNVWVGGARGIERFRASAFTSYAEGPAANSRGPVFVDEDSRVWFAPASGGLSWIRGSQSGQVTTDGLAGDLVYSIAGTKTDLWIGRQRGGLTRLSGSGQTFSATRYTEADGLAQNSIYAVHQARDGSVWAASLNRGVTAIKNGNLTTYTVASGLPSNSVTAIADDRAGNTWFGTPEGIAVLSNGRWRTYSLSDTLPSADVITLLDSSDNLMWVGTAGGLALVEDGRVRVPDNMPEVLREPIYGLAEDRAGSLWIATSGRVLRVARAALLRGALAESDLREYALADGLGSTEAMKRHRSVVADSTGRIWFSMNRGLSTVDPSRATRPSAPAVVHLQGIAADGAALDLRRPVHLNAPRQRITFAYAGLSLSVPERVRFRYRLDPFDRAWSEPTQAREAVYTNLSPGRYDFRVMASNSDGLWNGAEAVTRLNIDPVFWQTWWFRISAVGIAALTVLGVYRLRIQGMTRQLSVRFEERLAERTRIAQELHDTLLQGFLSASMQLHVVTEQLPEGSPARGALGRVLALMGQVIDEGRNAVRGLRSTTGTHDLEHAFSNIQEELGLAAQSAFRVIVDGQPRPLNPVIRDEVYRIGREALVNAFRHSGATRIELELEYAPKHLRLLVRDDGKGIEADVLKSGADGHWGLSGMRERAERIGAQLKVFSRASAGTEVELSIPGLVAWETQTRRHARARAE